MRTAFVLDHPQVTALRALNYSREVERLRRITAGRSSTRLGDVVQSFGKNYGKVFIRIDCQPAHGVELLSQSDMFAAEPDGRVVRKDSFPNAADHAITLGDILIAGAGTLGETELFGRSIIADRRLVGKYVGPHAIMLRMADPTADFSLYAYAFLCTAVGIRAVRSASYGTKVLGLRSSMLQCLPIPEPPTATVARVAALIREAIECRERFAAELQQARRSIESLPEVAGAYAECSVREARWGSYSPPFTTLNAWNYASIGNAATKLRRAWGAELGDVVADDGIFGGPRFTRVPCEMPHGVEMLTQRDIFLVRSVPQRIVRPEIPARQLYPPAGALLLGGVGTLGEGEIFGRVVLATTNTARRALTGDVLRIVPEEAHARLCYAFFSTLLGRRLLRSTAAGTKLLRMRPDLLRSLPIPSISTARAAAVSQHVMAAVAARDAAELAETAAVDIVESEVLPAWLS